MSAKNNSTHVLFCQMKFDPKITFRLPSFWNQKEGFCNILVVAAYKGVGRSAALEGTYGNYNKFHHS